MNLTDEAERLKDIRKILGKSSKKVILGSGDDATVAISPKKQLITAIHTLVEGVHFDLNYTNPSELGHKVLAVALSDMAAMGATPLYASFSIASRQDMSDPFIREFYRGVIKLAKKYKVDVIGTETAESPSFLVVHVVVQGEPQKKFLARKGAKPGDLIGVTGPLGASAAGLNCLRILGRDKLTNHPDIVKAHLTPTPKLAESKALVQSGAVTSMIDIADSLTKELHRLTDHSKVGAILEEDKVPLAKSAQLAAPLIAANPTRWAFYGGEDHELLFTLKPTLLKKAQSKLKAIKKNLFIIGTITNKKDNVQLQTKDGEFQSLEPREWHNFVRRQRA